MSTSSIRVVPPDPVRGVLLNPERDWFSVVVPEGTRNLYLNPSFELSLDTWSSDADGSGGTPVVRTTNAQFRGAYSVQLTVRPTGGTFVQFYAFPPLTVGATYTVSFHVKRSDGLPWQLSHFLMLYNGGGFVAQRLEYVGNGWHRVSATFAATTDGVGLRVYGAPGFVCYVDACQLEARAYPTTYCDGNELSLIPGEETAYYWEGPAHNSVSVRSAQCRGGGRVVNLTDYTFSTITYTGLGMLTPEIAATERAFLDGSDYQRSAIAGREIVITGQFLAATEQELAVQRDALYRALSSRGNAGDKALLLRFQKYQGFDVAGPMFDLPCVYVSGLEQDMSDLLSERVSITVRMLPEVGLVAAWESHATLGAAVGIDPPSSSPLLFLYQPDASGDYAWTVPTTLPLTAPSGVRSVAWSTDGRYVYIGGDLGGGVRVRQYDTQTSTLSDITSNLVGTVRCIAVTENGQLLAAGLAVVGTAHMASYSAGTWVAQTSGPVSPPSGQIDDLAVTRDGVIAVGTGFANAKRWTTTAGWIGLGGSAPAGNAVSVLDRSVAYRAIASSDTVTIHDDISAVGLTTTTITMGPGIEAVEDVLVQDNGVVYFVGFFMSANGVSCNFIGKWDGQRVVSVGQGLTGSGLTGPAWRLAQLHDGRLLVMGRETPSFYGALWGESVLTTQASALVWDGAVWGPFDIAGPLSRIDAFSRLGRSMAAVVPSNSDVSPTACKFTAVINHGTLPAPVKLSIALPFACRLVSWTNETTGQRIGAQIESDAVTGAGTVTLDLRRAHALVDASIGGPQWHRIWPGSPLGSFRLRPGNNRIGLHVSESADAVTGALVGSLVWRERYESPDGVR